MRIVLIRHCETDWNVEGRLQGQADTELNQNGCDQAENLAGKIAGVSLGITNIISSPLMRAAQTAEIIARTLNVPWSLDDRLRECSFGTLEGKIINEVKKTMDYNLVYRSHGDYDFQTVGGESREAVLTRHLDLLKTLITLGDRVPLLVGHGSGLNTLLTHLGDDSNLGRGEFKMIQYPLD